MYYTSVRDIQMYENCLKNSSFGKTFKAGERNQARLDRTERERDK
jgi:hypothetical protein